VPYAFDKEDLPKGLSFPIKRSVLNSVLDGRGILDELHHVYFSRPQRVGLVVRVAYCGEDRRGWFAAGKSGLWIFAVPSAERKQVEQVLIEEGMFVVTRWLEKLKSGGNVIRGNDQLLELAHSAGAISVSTTCEGLLTSR
jgi:hypothetical protein